MPSARDTSGATGWATNPQSVRDGTRAAAGPPPTAASGQGPYPGWHRAYGDAATLVGATSTLACVARNATFRARDVRGTNDSVATGEGAADGGRSTTGWQAALRRRLRAVVVDVRPLQDSHDFRLLFLGQVVNQIGSQMRMVALPYQVFLLTGSSAAVGALSLAQFVPLLIFSLIGGSVADLRDRRRILFFTQVLLAITSTVLAVAAGWGHPSVAFLFVLAAVGAGVSAFDQPARRAALPRLVAREQLPAAFALNGALAQLSSVVGPALGGVVLASVGIAAAYAIDAATFLVAIASLIGMAPIPPDPDAGPRRGGELAGVLEGLRYLQGRPVLIGTFLIDLVAMFFGSPRALFPQLATEVFRTGPSGLGLLYAAPAVGGLAAALTGGWLTRVRRQGRAVVGAVMAWGLAMAGFGMMTRHFPLALLLLAVAGAADMVSAVLRNTILQLAVPDRLRGRLSGVHFLVVTGGPRLGDMEAGTVAAWTNVQFSVVSGGLASVVGAVAVALALPAFVRYDAAADAL
jgi:hypothetical protein